MQRMECNCAKFIKWSLTIILSIYTPFFVVNMKMYCWDPILKLELENLYHEHEIHKMTTTSMDYSMKAVINAPTMQSQELKKIQDYIYYTLDKLQNEGKCEDKKMIRCSNSAITGFGSMMHRYVICLHIAFALNRTFFIDQEHLSKFNGLANFTALESGKCGYLRRTLNSIKDRCNFDDLSCYVDKDGWQIENKYKLLEFTQEAKFPAPKYIPGTIPNNIRKRLEELGVKKTWHWFTSQLLGYMILRPDGLFKQKYEAFLKETPLRYPMVGMHVRGTDKITEAKAVPLKKYIDKVKEIFEKELKVTGTRYIYVMSDDSRTIQSLKRVFSGHDYVIQGNTLPRELRNTGSRRDDSPEVMERILMDLNIMSQCSYNVVTFSSNIGRLVWELKTSLYPYTESETVVSMDGGMIYGWYAYDTSKYYLTIRNHTEEENINGITIMSYTKGMLFKQHGGDWEKKLKGKNGDIVTLKRLRVRMTNTIGFVYANDIREWPGSVEYMNDI